MADTTSLQLSQIHLKNFRCFKQNKISLEHPIVLIEGDNGTGKTSLLEALYYSCYLRSFRAHSPKDLTRFGQEGFFVKVQFTTSLLEQTFFHDIQIGFSGARRLVKVDQKAVSSYKDLMSHYRVVSLTEDDLELINGSPQVRRSFLDQAILLHNPDYINSIRAFRQVVDNRNALLQRGSGSRDTYLILTEQLWEKTNSIQQIRVQMLENFAKKITALAHQYIGKSVSIALDYRPKRLQAASFDAFMQAHSALNQEEIRWGRSLFGAHLDDFVIKFQDKKSKQFASRGQQKLVVLLLKVAQIKILSSKKGGAVFLLDDFMADFDAQRASSLISLLRQMDNQLIFTSPARGGTLGQQLQAAGGQVLKLTH